MLLLERSGSFHAAAGVGHREAISLNPQRSIPRSSMKYACSPSDALRHRD
jgi:hypothetical protein